MCELLLACPRCACSASSMMSAARCGCTSRPSGAAGVCWPWPPGGDQGSRRHRAHRSAGVWSAGPAGVAQASLVLPGGGCPVGRGRPRRAIAAPRLALTDRAGRWVTEQVGRLGRTVAELAEELGCDWHPVNDTVIAYGTALLDDDPERIGESSAVGIDEVLFVRSGGGAPSYGRRRSSTSTPAGFRRCAAETSCDRCRERGPRRCQTV